MSLATEEDYKTIAAEMVRLYEAGHSEDDVLEMIVGLDEALTPQALAASMKIYGSANAKLS